MKESLYKEVQTCDRVHRLDMPNVLLISGDNRNVGKTTLGCRIVNKLNTRVFAVKISPHFHPLTPSLEMIRESPLITITRETDKTSGKDSARYLSAGAGTVFYVQSKKEGLSTLVEWMHHNIPVEVPVVCESADLAEFIIPGFSIHIKGGQGEDQYSCKQVVLYNNFQPDHIQSAITWRNNNWWL